MSRLLQRIHGENHPSLLVAERSAFTAG